MLLLLASCVTEADAREHLAAQGFDDIELSAADPDGYAFTARTDGSDCTGTIRGEGSLMHRKWQVRSQCTGASAAPAARRAEPPSGPSAIDDGAPRGIEAPDSPAGHEVVTGGRRNSNVITGGDFSSTAALAALRDGRRKSLVPFATPALVEKLRDPLLDGLGYAVAEMGDLTVSGPTRGAADDGSPRLLYRFGPTADPTRHELRLGIVNGKLWSVDITGGDFGTIIDRQDGTKVPLQFLDVYRTGPDGDVLADGHDSIVGQSQLVHYHLAGLGPDAAGNSAFRVRVIVRDIRAKTELAELGQSQIIGGPVKPDRLVQWGGSFEFTPNAPAPLEVQIEVNDTVSDATVTFREWFSASAA
ncbi:MAG: hypothetical protein AAF721_01110 [Myxococcota bacterium]